MVKHVRLIGFLALALSALPVAAQGKSETSLRLESLDLKHMDADWGRPRAGRSVDNNPLSIGGQTFEHGVGTHAFSEMDVALNGAATRFTAMVGVDDEVKERGSVVFVVLVDGREAVRTPVMHGGDAARSIAVPLVGAKRMTLSVEDAGDDIGYDHANWANAVITLDPRATFRPIAIEAPIEPAPKIALGDPALPAIHGPRITGATPGNPFLFLIPATGQGPLTYSAQNLPAGITLDPKTGILSGALKTAGRTDVVIRVKGPKGEAGRVLTIVGGQNALALTPPMGWNSWNVWGCSVDDAKVRAAADAMVESGLAAKGYQYINIDDCWQDERGEDGEIRPNEKFPDMKALADYVHSKGLKLGIYSSPGPRTCANHTGSLGHEAQDAKTYARWGVDYLKYDWCSYGGVAKDNSLPELKKPYFVMRDALADSGRDIVYSLCQYGMGEVWKWGAEVGGNLWRTTGDITDSWGSMANIGFAHDNRSPYAGPGHWNDPDMLVVGKVGWGPNLHDTRLKPNEQITHISLWTLLAAPLLIGCDMTQMDDFTKALLTNTEVINVNQDPLGRAARRVAKQGRTEVWARPLYDGTMAVGLFNRSTDSAKVTVRWKDLGLSGRQPVRNLWLRKAEGIFRDDFTATVPTHGCVFLKVGTPK